MQHNRTHIADDLKSLAGNQQRLNANIGLLQQMRLHPIVHGSLLNTMSFDTMDTSAWRTARDTGALAYMPYDEVQRDSDLYAMADMVNDRAKRISEEEFNALAPMMMKFKDGPPQSEIDQMLRGNAESEIGLVTQLQYLKALDQMIQDDLNHP